MNVLHQAKFSDGHWEQLALQLIGHDAMVTVRADRRESSLCMIETISRWLKTDLQASWEKLAAAVAKVEEYQDATAHRVRQEAKIIHACMLVLISASIFYFIIRV